MMGSLRTRLRRTARGSVAMVAMVAMVSGAGPASAAPAGPAGWGPLVRVADGILLGTVNASTRQFLDIPYAAPPTGGLRFRPPQPAVPWPGIRNATQAGDICPQPGAFGNVSEDCLTLNVYTPASPPAGASPTARSGHLPVMVWFYGGGYFEGSASGYDPTPLVTGGNVIVVTVNYRVGPFGFLALPGLDAESSTTGNYGILDQQASLRWVRRNTAAFGGDPGNVTIFGESAGGNSVCMQMISPAAAGLFQKAISESGGCIHTPIGPATKAEAYAEGQSFAASAGCTVPASEVACLRGKSSQELVNAMGLLSPTGLAWRPVVDGTVIPQAPAGALASGRYNHVPLIIGTTHDEGRLVVALVYNLAQLGPATPAELTQDATTLAADAGVPAQDIPALRAAYPPASSTDADLALSSVITDGVLSCPALFAAQDVASHPGEAVYQYEFDDPSPPGSGLDPLMPLGDYHGSELSYLFSRANGLTTPTLTAAQQSLSNQMISYWTMFARTGDPNAPGTPAWPALTAGSAQVQQLTSQGTAPFPASAFAAGHHCQVWAV
jgi:para-nitrobenzyl esterase